MRNRPDLIRILGYIALGVIIGLVLWWGFSQIQPVEAAPKMGRPVFCPALNFCPTWMGDVKWETFVQKSSDFTQEELDLVVRTLACESPYEPLSGIRAVAHVIKTRVETRNLSYEQVVKEPWQFSCWNSHIPRRLIQLRDEPREALGTERYNALKWIAMGVMSGDLSDPFPGADLYYSHCSIRPPFWVYQSEFLGRIGCHSFYKSK